jgi:dTMP kinase
VVNVWIGVLKTRGLLITLEGIDGCGKSTQTALLKQRFEEHAVPFIPVREPGGTALGEDIRQVLLHKDYAMSLQAELLLYMAARSELTGQVIIPALKAGRVILCDRFTDSTLAYQGYGGGADLGFIRRMNSRATRGTVPNLTVLLDLPVENALARRGEVADRMESRDIRYHQRVRHGYLEIARREPRRIKVIDAKGDAQEQHLIIWKIVDKLITRHAETGFGYEF